MIYFDNASTGGFKPSTTIDACMFAIKSLSVNPSRSNHELALVGENILYKTRKTVAKFFNTDSPHNVVFTKNCTEALNIAILGTVKIGGNVVTTIYEHNSVLRPLYYLESKKLITLTIVEPNAVVITASDIEKAICNDTYMVIVNGVSNVTGTANDISGIGMLCKQKNITFLVDGAQMAGHYHIDMINDNIDLLTVAGHKGMHAIQGIGCLLIKGDIDINPLTHGGVGVDSFNHYQPNYMPEKLEAGTHNLPSICSLLEGCKYTEKSIDTTRDRLYDLTEYLIDKLAYMPFIKLFSIPNHAGIVSFLHSEIPSENISESLSVNYGIATRAGFHCAPLIHKFLQTTKFGLVRVSFDSFNTKKEINCLIDAISQLTYA